MIELYYHKIILFKSKIIFQLQFHEFNHVPIVDSQSLKPTLFISQKIRNTHSDDFHFYLKKNSETKDHLILYFQIERLN